MPEFKLNGKTYSGSTNYASAITYTEDDGSKTTVQDKISELNSNFDELSSNLSPENLTVNKVTDSTVTAYNCKKSGNVITGSFNCSISKALDIGTTWYQFAKITSNPPSSTIYFPVVYNYVNPTVGRINTSGAISFITKSVQYTKDMPIYGNFSYIIN